MKITTVFDNIPQRKKSKDNRLKDLLRVLKVVDPTKIPKDLTVRRLREISDYVTENDVDFEEFQVFMRKLTRIPSTVGSIGYI